MYLSKIAFEIAHKRSLGIHLRERARDGKQITLIEEKLVPPRSSAILIFMPVRALRFRIQRSPANQTSALERVWIYYWNITDLLTTHHACVAKSTRAWSFTTLQNALNIENTLSEILQLHEENLLDLSAQSAHYRAVRAKPETNKHHSQ